MTHPVERVGPVARGDARPNAAADPVDRPQEASRPVPPAPGAITAPADAIALGAARDRIAAVLAVADAAGGADGIARTVAALNTIPPLPVAPGADARDLADVQALAGLIAANARPALAAQARIGRAAVRLMIDD